MKAISHLEGLYLIGSKHAGAGGDLKAAEYIENTFEKYGLENVDREFFTCTSWEFGSSEAVLKMNDGKTSRIAVLPYFFSGSTPMEGFSGEIAYVESVRILKYMSEKEIKNKIVLLNEEDVTEEDYVRIIELGASALLMITERENPIIGQFLISDMLKYRRIPILSVISTDAEFIIKNGIRHMSLSVDAHEIMNARTCNVTGELYAKDAVRNIVVGAHFDTVPIPYAAKDNTAGISIILALAGRLSKLKLKNYNIHFAAFSSEELNREGAYNYIKKHEKTLENTALMINVDGNGDYLGKNVAQVMGDIGLGSFCGKVAEKLRYPLRVDNIDVCYLDNAFFTSVGIPSIFMARFPNKAWHSLYDTPDSVSAGELEKAVDYIAEFIRMLDDYGPVDWKVDKSIVERLNRELPHLNKG